MKRFFAVALALLLTTGAFAQKRVEKATEQKFPAMELLNKGNQKTNSEFQKLVQKNLKKMVNKMSEGVETVSAFVNFSQAVKEKQYHDYNFIFQAMDEVRVSFMALQAKSSEQATRVAKTINRPVAIANGSYFLTLENYLRMETVNLPQSEQVKFDEFHAALVKALDYAAVVDVNSALPKAYAESVVAFRKFVSSTKELNANWILQSMMNPMDEFNAQLQKNPQLGPAMAKEFVKPIKTSWGTVKPLDIINEYAITLQGPVQDDLFDFRDNLVRLGAK
ncbi:hypothetical protein [Candidatus Avelusimicrobium fimicolum]|uniref:hypothetical protein n=1 Tax=Candidatus Avelusimicrobium fimicolum TaxID=3416216 RepID=UPI003D0FE863